MVQSVLVYAKYTSSKVQNDVKRIFSEIVSEDVSNDINNIC